VPCDVWVGFLADSTRIPTQTFKTRRAELPAVATIIVAGVGTDWNESFVLTVRDSGGAILYKDTFTIKEASS